MISISIVMTAYNVEQYLFKAMNSVLSSSLKNIELIVVDDCSTDSTMQVIKLFKDPRLKVLIHTYNQGAGMSRRHGIEIAKGEYVITIDADDYISLDFLLNLYIKAKQTKADIVGGGLTVIQGDIIDELPLVEKESQGMEKFIDYQLGRIIFLNNKIVKRSMYDKITYCGRRYIEDTPTIIPLLYNANKIAYIESPGYFYNMREDSLTHKADIIKDNLYKALCAIDCYEYLKDKPKPYNSIVPAELIIYHIVKLLNAIKNPIDVLQYIDDYMQMAEWFKLFLLTDDGKRVQEAAKKSMQIEENKDK